MKTPTNLGAFTAPAQKAAIETFSQQGSDGEVMDCSPVHIARMLQQVFTNERDIRAWEDMKASKAKRRAMGDDGKLEWRLVSDLVGDSLADARTSRDEHIADIKHRIDYALTVGAYETLPCGECRLPSDALGFAKGVASFEATADCASCGGDGKVRVKRSDPTSKADFKRISYFEKVLDDVVLCAKVRARTSDQHEAYAELESRNRTLLVKFGNEKQTSLEGEDAEQGARMGIIDAARRFDPTLPSMASFNTVAFNWCRRNSRARHDWQKRAGVYAPSVEAMGTDDEGNGMAALITDTHGGVGTFGAPPPSLRSLQMDVEDQLQRLPGVERTIVSLEMTGHNVAQISRELGMSAVKVRRLRANAFERLREGLVGYVLRE